MVTAGETQSCAEAAAERVTFLEEQITGMNAEAEKAARDAEEALAAAQAAAAEQLAAALADKDAAIAEARAQLSAAQVRSRHAVEFVDTIFARQRPCLRGACPRGFPQRPRLCHVAGEHLMFRSRAQAHQLRAML